METKKSQNPLHNLNLCGVSVLFSINKMEMITNKAKFENKILTVVNATLLMFESPKWLICESHRTEKAKRTNIVKTKNMIKFQM